MNSFLDFITCELVILLFCDFADFRFEDHKIVQCGWECFFNLLMTLELHGFASFYYTPSWNVLNWNMSEFHLLDNELLSPLTLNYHVCSSHQLQSCIYIHPETWCS